MKKFILFDHDGVLVDTEYWYFKAAERALIEVGFELDKDRYLSDTAGGRGSWAQVKASGVNEETLVSLRTARNAYYQDYLRTEPIEIDRVEDVLGELSKVVSMGIVTTSKGADFELIHEHLQMTKHMDFVLARENYSQAKPDPEPYMAGLRRSGAKKSEVLVVEDSSRGLQSAVAAGLDCVIVHNTFTGGQDFTNASARIHKLAELKDLVRNWH